MTQIKENMRDSYNNKAAERDSSSIQDWKVKERDKFYSVIENARAESLLEIGAGPGKDGLFFKEKGLDVVCTDLSPEMVKLCQEKGLQAKVMSFEELDFPDSSFDSVWALNCLLHVPKNKLENVLSGIKRVLKPGGHFFMGVYGGDDFEGIWEDDFYEPKRFFSFYEDETMKEIVSKEFKVEYFNVVPKEIVGGDFHFQSMILRK